MLNRELQDRLDKANNVPIRDIMVHFGYHPVKEMADKDTYKSPFRDEKEPSMRVTKRSSDPRFVNKWQDFGEDGKVNDAVNLVCRIMEYSRQFEGVKYIESNFLGAYPLADKPAPTPSRKIPAKANNTPNYLIRSVSDSFSNISLIQYAASRGISLETLNASRCVELTYSRNGYTYDAIALKIDEGGYEVRCVPPRDDPKKGKYTLGHKGVSTLRNNTDTMNENCLVFEGMFNYLSYLQLYGTSSGQDIIVLNGKDNAGSLEYLCHKGVKNLYFFADNDDAGREALDTACRITGCLVFDMSWLYTPLGLSDLNEFLIVRRK